MTVMSGRGVQLVALTALLPFFLRFANFREKFIAQLEHVGIDSTPDGDEATIDLFVDVEHIDDLAIDRGDDPATIVLRGDEVESSGCILIKLE